MKIKIKVTKEVLYRTQNCGRGPNWYLPSNCAVAYAVREIFPKADVGSRFIDLGPFLESVPLPPEATTFIFSFDNAFAEERIHLPEFSFEIDVPGAVIHKIGIGEVYRVLSESKTLELAENLHD